MNFIRNLGPIQKRLLLVLVVVLLIGGGIGIYRFINKPDSLASDTTSKTTSDVESAQADFSDGGPREPAPAQDQTNVGVTDSRGSTPGTSNSAPLKSRDGVVTVTSPGANTVFSRGGVLAGNSTSSKVSYRLIDDVSGVIATGELAVVNGKFSGTFNFSTSATNGRLDVFVPDSGGVENSIVEIPVRFK